MEKVLWKLYWLGRKNEYKLLGFVWASPDITPQSKDGGCVNWRHPWHSNLCADMVNDTSHEQEWWMKPWPWSAKEAY